MLAEGDQNSKYFHAATKNRRTTNKIIFLKDRNGCKLEWGSGLENHITDYFNSLFKATYTSWDRVVDCHNSIVTAQNAMLLEDVEEKEIKAAFFHMHPDKSPGPDGMSPGFYLKC